jgi:chemotaxis signal transduction protein
MKFLVILKRSAWQMVFSDFRFKFLKLFQEATMQYATFMLNELLFGIPIYVVQEFSRSSKIHPVVGHDPRIAGFVNLRGTIASAIDLKLCLGLPEFRPASAGDGPITLLERQNIYSRKKMVVLETTAGLGEEAIEEKVESYDEPIVLLVDSIRSVVNVDVGDFHPPPAHVQEPYVEGVVKVDDILLTILSIPALTAELAGGLAA